METRSPEIFDQRQLWRFTTSRSFNAGKNNYPSGDYDDWLYCSYSEKNWDALNSSDTAPHKNGKNKAPTPLRRNARCFVWRANSPSLQIGASLIKTSTEENPPELDICIGLTLRRFGTISPN
ncbi:hypothetical protein TNCV_3629061 [Trichonephila clavipes]|nr:hypothetical protein TNCV_3629061 [Trichonephila clavipes]